MNTFKLNTFSKFVCFILIIILVISCVGFASKGWQFDLTNPNDSSLNSENNDSDSNDNNASEKDGQEDTETIRPTFFSTSTGLEISEEQFNNYPIGIVFDPFSPVYGASNSDITIEFPIEDGTSRLLTYSTDENTAWKIGSILPTRSFISNMSIFFGGTVVSYGKDDIITYDYWDTSSVELDISKYSDCHYVENKNKIYTNETLIKKAQSLSSSNTNNFGYNEMPFGFLTDEEYFGYNDATSLKIPYSITNETNFYYNESKQNYLLYKNGNRIMDMLSGENLAYKNLFILFANTTTYENSSGSELVIDTMSGGKGYYISEGKLTEFTWSVDKTGKLSFQNLMGEKLYVNRGNSFISYFKISNSTDIIFS